MKIGNGFKFIIVLVMVLFDLPAFAIDTRLEVSIAKCGCDSSCFTEEVTNVQCTSRGIEFESHGLPNPSHTLMRGITATNQQYPRAHDYQITIPKQIKRAVRPLETEPGPIGVAVNGVPLFDPGTQGPIEHGTGKPAHTLDVGELDECGGHAGRGDDYHYHIAPKCLIDDLGAKRIEQRRQPIGFANDGFAILALGWFDSANNIESRLDGCRGMKDKDGRYFYNVKVTAKWDILNCYFGQKHRISRDRWTPRRDRTGAEIVGAKASFHIMGYRTEGSGSDLCHVMEGRLVDQRVLNAPGQIRRIAAHEGTIFYCNSGCYAEFYEPEPKPGYRGPILFYDLITEACPSYFNPQRLTLFEPYKGPALQRKRAGGGQREKPPRSDRPPRRN